MFATLANGSEPANESKGKSKRMATDSNSSKEKAQAKRATTEAGKSAADTAKAGRRAAGKAAAAEKSQVQAVAETAVDFPVGLVLTVSDRVAELVEPWTGRSSAEKQIKAYRTQLRKTLKRTERRGSTARRRAASEARKTRNRVERQARKRQRTVETTLKRNRADVERRARSVVDQVADQLAAIR